MEHHKEGPSDRVLEQGIDSLKKQLQEAGIDISLWSTGQAKTVEHLQKEIEEGETVLIKDENGELLRRVTVGNADIYYTTPEGKRLRLKEEKQIFRDGRERKRNLGAAVSEKMRPGEDPAEAMARGIKEELGVEGEITISKTDTDQETLTSPSYPGLLSQYIHHKFRVELGDKQFKPEGYIEEQKDKNTYFVWEPAE